MKKLLTLIALFGAISLMAGDISAIAKKCSTCHGKDGGKKALNASKILKDMSKADFIASMKGYQTKTYGGKKKNLMYPQVKNLNDAQIEALADKYTTK